MPDFTQLTPDDRAEMLRTIGIDRVEALFGDVPEDARFPVLDLPPALSELEASRHLGELAGQNVSVRDWPCFIGGGAYNHYAPSAVGHISRWCAICSVWTWPTTRCTTAPRPSARLS